MNNKDIVRKKAELAKLTNAITKDLTNTKLTKKQRKWLEQAETKLYEALELMQNSVND